jgi:hypothetical protein
MLAAERENRREQILRDLLRGELADELAIKKLFAYMSSPMTLRTAR